GHEAAQAGAGLAMRAGADLLYPYYRDTGLCLAFGLTPLQVLYSQFARARDVNGGRQFPSHWSGRAYGIGSVSSILAAQMPHAVGAAYAMRFRGETDRAVLCSFGEGTTSEGEWHESLNFASVRSLPVIFFCQNNGWAISTPQHMQMAVAHVADRAPGYGMEGIVVDGMDPVAVYEAVSRARRAVVEGSRPVLVEAMCRRVRAHSTDDDDRTYRSAEELAELRAFDPVARYRDRLVASGIASAGDLDTLEHEIAAEIDRSTDAAEAEPYPNAADLYTNVTEAPWQPWQ
ncbi:MAG: thiamine pyrophosphate-dependent dehydrogenase E1 component subunit alpha, partial [Vulcanimicrobiaceae bacterium]